MFVSHELAAAAIILFLLLLLLGGILMGVVFYGAGYDCGLKDGLELGDLAKPRSPKGENYDRISNKMV